MRMGTALGNLIAGLAAGGFAGVGVGELFAAVAKVTGIAGIVLLLFSKPLKAMIGDRDRRGGAEEAAAAEVGVESREEALPT